MEKLTRMFERVISICIDSMLAILVVVVLIFMGKADLNKQVNLVFVTMVWKKGMMLHSFYVKN